MKLTTRIARVAVAALVAAGALAASVGLSASAHAADQTLVNWDGNKDASLTVTAPDGVDISAKKLVAVPLAYISQAVTSGTGETAVINSFDITKVDDATNAMVANALTELGVAASDYEANNPMAYVVKNYLDSTSSPYAGNLRNFVQAYVKQALAASGDNTFTGTALTAVDGSTNKLQLTGLQPGIYLIKDNTSNNDNAEFDGTNSSAAAIPMLVGTSFNGISKLQPDSNTDAVTLGEVEYKAVNEPVTDKKIVGDNNQESTSSKNAIGDTVHFRISTTVPVTTGFTSYRLLLRDTLSKGLTFREISKVVVYKDANDTTGTELEDLGSDAANPTGYFSSVSTSDQNTSILVNLSPEGKKDGVTNYSNILQNDASRALFAIGARVVVDYTATVNQDAVINGTGNLNTLDVMYSNNPNEERELNTTPPTSVTVYTGSITLHKTDMDGNNLAGAKFTIKNADGTALKFVAGDNGLYTLAADQTATDGVVTELTTPDSGVLTINGLGPATYTIAETESPFSNPILPTFTAALTITSPATASDPVYTALDVTSDANNLAVKVAGTTDTTSGALTSNDSVQVKNPRNFMEMPKTGAAWLAIYAFGAVLFAAGAWFLLFSKRVQRKDD